MPLSPSGKESLHCTLEEAPKAEPVCHRQVQCRCSPATQNDEPGTCPGETGLGQGCCLLHVLPQPPGRLAECHWGCLQQLLRQPLLLHLLHYQRPWARRGAHHDGSDVLSRTEPAAGAHPVQRSAHTCAAGSAAAVAGAAALALHPGWVGWLLLLVRWHLLAGEPSRHCWPSHLGCMGVT